MILQPRYSLLALFIAITLSSVVVAITLAHGFFGLLLLLPHIAVTIGIALLLRRKLIAFATLLATFYCSLWAATAFFGVPQIREQLRTIVKTHENPYFGDLQQLKFDPILSDMHNQVSPPWHFVGNESVPCPLVVVADYGWMAAPTDGQGGRSYFLWLFGYDVKIRHRLLWLS
jgi:hypothetical protein